MKAFVISISILLALFGLTIFNSIFINKVTTNLINEARELKIENESISNFADKWERAQTFIKLSSSHKETHKIDEVLGVLEAKAKIQNNNGFEEEKALLVEYITQIQEDEKVSLDSII